MKKTFSIWIYLFIVIVLSWPFQCWFVFKAETAADRYLYSSLSMVMVTVATLIAGRLVFKDGFKQAGWSLGKPMEYVWVILLALLIWLVPAIIEYNSAGPAPGKPIAVTEMLTLFAISFAATLIPAFGEEFGWRGYMLPRLASLHGAKKGLLIHAFIWWAWHLPVLVGMGLKETTAGSSAVSNLVLFVCISIIPSMLHAVLFAFIWSKTRSLAVATVYHAAFDEVRDTLEKTTGFGTFTESWQMIVIIIAGGLLLWKANWEKLLPNQRTTFIKP
jgi:membrane protease YdiL (CAAX protease family)